MLLQRISELLTQEDQAIEETGTQNEEKSLEQLILQQLLKQEKASVAEMDNHMQLISELLTEQDKGWLHTLKMILWSPSNWFLNAYAH